MGYSHYWKRIGAPTDEDEKLYQVSLDAIKAMIESAEIPQLRHAQTSEYPILFSPQFDPDRIHEKFELPGTLEKMKEFNSCKTNRLPYDLYVVGSLFVLSFYLRSEVFNFSSDGNISELMLGKKLADRVIQQANAKGK